MLRMENDSERITPTKYQYGVVYHYWVSHRHGYLFSTSKECPISKKERVKYMGFTSDIGWPKEMSTGRMLYKPNPKTIKKKNKKLSLVRKTVTSLNSNG